MPVAMQDVGWAKPRLLYPRRICALVLSDQVRRKIGTFSASPQNDSRNCAPSFWTESWELCVSLDSVASHFSFLPFFQQPPPLSIVPLRYAVQNRSAGCPRLLFQNAQEGALPCHWNKRKESYDVCLFALILYYRDQPKAKRGLCYLWFSIL